MTCSNIAGKPRVFRYFFYLISSCRLRGYRSWKQAGEPNPFVAKTYRAIQTERVEFTDLFEEIQK